MPSSTAWGIIGMVGWYFLPDMLSRTAYRFYHNARLQILPILGLQPKPPPAPGTPEFVKQQRFSFAFVVLSYLLWTTSQAYFTTPTNLYQILNVPQDADEATMKTAYRTFARYNHPDKVGAQGEPLFILVRDAYEALKNPVKRFAYDRFGVDALEWKHCQTPRDYVKQGLMTASGFYIGTSLFMVLFAIFGKGGIGAFWRYTLFATIAALELQMLVGDAPRFLSYVLPNRLPFQHILFLHQLFISTSIAITRVGPILFPSLGPPSDPVEQAKEVATWAKPVAEKLVMLSQMAEKEVSRMLAVELRAMHGVASSASSQGTIGGRPELQRQSTIQSEAGTTFTINNDIMDRLRLEMENMIVDKNLRGHPMLRTIWEDAVKRKLEELRRQREEEEAVPAVNTSSITIKEDIRPSQVPADSLPSPPTSIGTLPPITGMEKRDERAMSQPPERGISPLSDIGNRGSSVAGSYVRK